MKKEHLSNIGDHHCHNHFVKHAALIQFIYVVESLRSNRVRHIRFILHVLYYTICLIIFNNLIHAQIQNKMLLL